MSAFPELSIAHLPLLVIEQISAGLYHNCARSCSGHIYLWGLNPNLRGSESKLSSPELLESLLLENGGGRVIDVSVCNSHFVAVTDLGDVYSWNCSDECEGVSAQRNA